MYNVSLRAYPRGSRCHTIGGLSTGRRSITTNGAHGACPLQLAVLEEYTCQHDHKHAQSRGKDLKVAENYTYEYTDLVHSCFESSARDTACAMALLLADDEYETMDQNAQLWDTEMRSLFLAETWKDFGNTQTSKEYAKAMLNEYLATVCLSQVRDRVSAAQDLVVAITDTQPSALCRLGCANS